MYYLRKPGKKGRKTVVLRSYSHVAVYGYSELIQALKIRKYMGGLHYPVSVI
jgi:hypothetical protein